MGEGGGQSHRGSWGQLHRKPPVVLGSPNPLPPARLTALPRLRARRNLPRDLSRRTPVTMATNPGTSGLIVPAQRGR